MKPKPDKARKEWLAGLCEGDLVAVVDDTGRRLNCSTIRVGRAAFYAGGANFSMKSGCKSKSTWAIVPATQDEIVQHRRDGLVQRLSFAQRTQWCTLTTEQLEAVAAMLWPETAHRR